MKKCMNQSDDFVDESLAGIYEAYPDFYTCCDGDIRALVHPGKKEGKVSIITGGGYGHLPVFLGYAGDGLYLPHHPVKPYRMSPAQLRTSPVSCTYSAIISETV